VLSSTAQSYMQEFTRVLWLQVVRARWPLTRMPSCKLDIWVRRTFSHRQFATYYYSTMRLILIYRPSWKAASI